MTNNDAAWNWAPILEDLSNAVGDWTIFKHLESALTGDGDIDSAVPRSSWDHATEALRNSLASASSATHVLWCEHVPEVRLCFILDPKQLPIVREVDFAASCSFFGATWGWAEAMVPLSTVGGAGYRQLGAGAQSIVEVTLYGIDRLGRSKLDETRARRIRSGMRADLRGAETATTQLLPTKLSSAALDLAQSVADGGWDRRAAVYMLQSALMISLRKPSPALARLRFKARDHCSLFQLAISGRRTVVSHSEFVSHFGSGHRVVEV